MSESSMRFEGFLDRAARRWLRQEKAHEMRGRVRSSVMRRLGWHTGDQRVYIMGFLAPKQFMRGDVPVYGCGEAEKARRRKSRAYPECKPAE